MSRLLAIAAELSEPPSSPTCWREVTLTAAQRDYETVAVCPEGTIDLYYRWLRRYGLMDYVEDILTPDELEHTPVTVEIEGGPGRRLTTFNLWDVLRLL